MNATTTAATADTLPYAAPTAPLALYLLDEHGEAVRVYFFCVDRHRSQFAGAHKDRKFHYGTDSDALRGTVCDQCGVDLGVA